MRRAPSHARAGFTVLEVVLAMFVLFLGMTSILALLSFGTALSRTAALRAAAAGSIEAVVADLEEHLFPLEVVDGEERVGEPRAIVDRPVPGQPDLRYSASAVPNPDDARQYRVDVEIGWAAGGQRRVRRFQTLLLREVPFGTRLRQRFVQGLEPETGAGEDARDGVEPGEAER